MPVLVGKSVSADILKSISDFDINRSPEFVVSEESNAVSHTGKIDKYNAALVFTKDENQIYIALSNYSNSSPINLFNNINKTLAPFYG